MTIDELYSNLADLQGKTADLCFHVKGCLFPVEMPEDKREKIYTLLGDIADKGLEVVAFGQYELFSA